MSLAAAAAAAVAAWDLNEASGTRADQVGSETLTDHGSVGSSTGKVTANCAVFTLSSSQELYHADDATVSVGDIQFTIRCWIKLTSKVNSAIAVAKWDFESDNREYILLYDSGFDRFRFGVSQDGTGSSAAVNADNLGSPSTGTWYLIHAWHDSVANEVGIAVNAGTADTASYSSGVFNGASPMAFGGMVNTSLDPISDGGGFHLNDVVLLKNYVMDSSDRTADYNSGTGVAFADWTGGGGTDYFLTGGTGAITLSGGSAGFRTQRRFAGGTGAISLSGGAAVFTRSLVMVGYTGRVTISGSSVWSGDPEGDGYMRGRGRGRGRDLR